MVSGITVGLERTSRHGNVGGMLRLSVKEVAEKAGFRNALDLSQRSHLPYESVRRIWQGTASMVSLSTLERLCQILEVRPAQLFDYDPEPLPTPEEIERKSKIKIRRRQGNRR